MLAALEPASINDYVRALAARSGLGAGTWMWQETPEPVGRDNSRNASYTPAIIGPGGQQALAGFAWLSLPDHYRYGLLAMVDLRFDFDAIRLSSDPISAPRIPADLRVVPGEPTGFFAQEWQVTTASAAADHNRESSGNPPAGPPRLELYIQNERPEQAGSPRPRQTLEMIDLSEYGQPRTSQVRELAVGMVAPLGLADTERWQLVGQALSRMTEDSGFHRDDERPMTNCSTPGSASAPNIAQGNDARLLEQAEDLVGPVEAAMLYGSCARGNATMQSDVDVLVIVRDNPGGVSDGALAITAYRAGHLRTLADRGSLFVLHLVRDGRILHDPAGELADILAAYKAPADPDRLEIELAAAASGLLAATVEERAAHGPAMRNLAYYLIRTAIYGRCAKQGEPEFDSAAAASALGLGNLAPLIAARRDAYTDDSLSRVLAALPAVLPPNEPLAAGLAAAAVRAAFDWPLASDLLAGVFIGDAVDYTALTLPPA
jgi:hypothetical protein